jgi:hypothetical protein
MHLLVYLGKRLSFKRNTTTQLFTCTCGVTEQSCQKFKRHAEKKHDKTPSSSGGKAPSDTTEQRKSRRSKPYKAPAVQPLDPVYDLEPMEVEGMDEFIAGMYALSHIDWLCTQQHHYAS